MARCPKCVELKLPREGAAFCFCFSTYRAISLLSTQDCFKASWSSHKSVHQKAKLSSLGTGTPAVQNSASPNEGWLYCLKKGQARTPKIPFFDWTGTLRPYPISSKRIVPDHIDLPDWAIDGIPKIEPNSDLQHIVEIKTTEQIERMRETCRSVMVVEVAADCGSAGGHSYGRGGVVKVCNASGGRGSGGGGVEVVMICCSQFLKDLSEQQDKLDPQGKRMARYIQVSCSNKCRIQIAREVLDAAARVIRPGVTTDEIDRVVHEATITAGMSNT
ncbi:Methionine aminopeptidase 1A [Vitis vinifera]|uniref:Methionine aminopeptidase 1A n=1 Tax=Vitis vinifera TaxID=29760 RepID=A0A438E0A8_VITVI|nr:Methionine aminopeptidase 1A [Vitis vinifera]